MPHSGHVILVTFGGSNAGDVLSDPSIYLRLPRGRIYRERWHRLQKMHARGSSPSDCLIIFGGGGVLDASRSRARLLDSLSRQNGLVLWGVGSNRPNQAAVTRTLNNDELEARTYNLDRFTLVGLRDFHCEPRGTPPSGISYVPCASALMRALSDEVAPRRSVGIIKHAFLNEAAPYELNTSIPSISMSLKRFSIGQIIQFIGESEAIYTESYHAAYWALLMGKKVIVQSPSSSKFSTLQYPVTFATSSLEVDLERANSAPFPNFLEDARMRNREFKSRVVDVIKSHRRRRK